MLDPSPHPHPVDPLTIRRRHRWSPPTTVAVGAVFALSAAVAGCGETYVDTSVTVPETGPVSTVPAVTYDISATLPSLLDQIKVLMSDLDERILDERNPTETLTAIDALWAAARPQIDADDPPAATAFDEAIKLAHSGVEKRRPADASKGYKIFLDLLDHYTAN